MELHKSAQIPLKLPPNCTLSIRQFPWQVSGDTQSIRAANWQDTGDYGQPDPRAGDRGQPDPQSWQVSGTQSQPSRKSWQVLGHQVCRAANPGTHGPSVPETREAMSSALTEL
ncbi:hypothetical protein Prudu_122S000300 [Prunus dulcis]|uniref:Uncharacterized protein n=1 Tax=Prunus dulcis TaxID=3755 RepID=A0A5H2XTW1_PRUDU|nr:hypothetical protein Prudu_122S000300 [Prunus dulcis]